MLDHVQSDDVDDIVQLLHENREAFAKTDIDLGFLFCDVIPHDVRMTEVPSLRLPYRGISPAQVQEKKRLLQEMVEKRIEKRII